MSSFHKHQSPQTLLLASWFVAGLAGGTTLDEVVEHYRSCIQRGPTLDPNLAKHPEKGLNLSKEDKAALVAFLKTLTHEKSPPP